MPDIALKLRRLGPRRRRRQADSAMSVVEHLSELRRRLVVSLVALAACAVVAFAAYDRILDFLIDPYCRLSSPPRPPGPCSLFIT
ncbi:MAG: twin-arginine translocase subunit TatC, partial [Actinomycetota bacterium]|nr:twin-arginine translocase subunit TatC [Actinomycetota bacterium]